MNALLLAALVTAAAPQLLPLARHSSFYINTFDFQKASTTAFRKY